MVIKIDTIYIKFSINSIIYELQVWIIMYNYVPSALDQQIL